MSIPRWRARLAAPWFLPLLFLLALPLAPSPVHA